VTHFTNNDYTLVFIKGNIINMTKISVIFNCSHKFWQKYILLLVTVK